MDGESVDGVGAGVVVDVDVVVVVTGERVVSWVRIGQVSQHSSLTADCLK